MKVRFKVMRVDGRRSGTDECMSEHDSYEDAEQEIGRKCKSHDPFLGKTEYYILKVFATE